MGKGIWLIGGGGLLSLWFEVAMLVVDGIWELRVDWFLGFLVTFGRSLAVFHGYMEFWLCALIAFLTMRILVSPPVCLYVFGKSCGASPR